MSVYLVGTPFFRTGQIGKLDRHPQLYNHPLFKILLNKKKRKTVPSLNIVNFYSFFVYFCFPFVSFHSLDMSYEINESRTPPTVMLSLTPTYDKEFNYPQNPPLVLSAERFKDVSNLKVNQRRSRSFTPVKGSFYMRSPELSPIGISNKGQHTPEVNASVDSGRELFTPGEFKVPQPISTKGTTPTGPPHTHHHHSQKENQFGTPKCAEDPNQTQNLDKSASHGYLNHKLDVRLILKNASMQQYIKAFNKEKIDFEKFLTLCEEDLMRLGVKRKVDRKVISSLINDLNAN